MVCVLILLRYTLLHGVLFLVVKYWNNFQFFTLKKGIHEWINAECGGHYGQIFNAPSEKKSFSSMKNWFSNFFHGLVTEVIRCIWIIEIVTRVRFIFNYCEIIYRYSNPKTRGVCPALLLCLVPRRKPCSYTFGEFCVFVVRLRRPPAARYPVTRDLSRVSLKY